MCDTARTPCLKDGEPAAAWPHGSSAPNTQAHEAAPWHQRRGTKAPFQHCDVGHCRNEAARWPGRYHAPCGHTAARDFPTVSSGLVSRTLRFTARLKADASPERRQRERRRARRGGPAPRSPRAATAALLTVGTAALCPGCAGTAGGWNVGTERSAAPGLGGRRGLRGP